MLKLLKPTLIFIISLVLTYGLVTYLKPQQQSVGLALPSIVSVFETSLQTGITSTATTLTLTANSIRGGGALSGFSCVTLDEGNSNAEQVCGTVSGTTMSSITRGISYSDGITEVAANKYSHRRGASVKLTDSPIIQRLKAQNNGDSTFVNQLTYESYLTPVDDEDIISKKYVDDIAIAGASDGGFTTKGIYEQATQIEMASSTGAVGSQKALTSLYATSTPTVRGLYVPVSENDGYLSQLWLDLTENFAFSGTNTFSGLNTFTATTTMATTTIAELTVSGDTSTVNLTSTGTQTLNGIDYTFPATESASSTVLSTDGSGNLSWKTIQDITIVTGTSSDTDMSGTDATATRTATCPSGTKVVSGGGVCTSNCSNIFIIDTYPSSATVWTTKWQVRSTDGSGSMTAGAYAICISQ